MIDPSHLTAFVSSRLCHDLVSPVSSAMSALEMMEEPGGEEMHEQAEALVKKGLSDAAAKLEFLRYAFGSQGLNSGMADVHQAKAITERFVATYKPSIEWDIETAHFGYSHVRLMMNMVLIAVDCVPWGGVISVKIRDENGSMSLTVDAKGDRTQLKEVTVNGLAGNAPEEGWCGKSVQPVFAQMMAKDLGSDGINVSQVSDLHVQITATGVRSGG